MSKTQDYANEVFGEEYPDITTEEIYGDPRV